MHKTGLVLTGDPWYNGVMYESQYAIDADSAGAPGWPCLPRWVIVQRLGKHRIVWTRTYYTKRAALELELAVHKTPEYIPF